MAIDGTASPGADEGFAGGRAADGVAPARVVLHVSGGIAAYKACEVMRLLQQAGCEVRVCMTEGATRFVSALTFEALSGHPVGDALFGSAVGAIPHVELARWADVQAVVPATANVLAKMATGLADDLVGATLLAATGPVLVAPAMNERMWLNPATQHNLSTLLARGVLAVGPDAGRLACGDVGAGKLADVGAIAEAILASSRTVPKDLLGLHVVVTAGPTHEAIDSVRFLSNSSSGKMGYAIAREAARRGATVTLVSGPVALATPWGVRRVDVVSAAEMHAEALALFADADVAVCAAAVADYTPRRVADHKLKKSSEPLGQIELVETADILADLSRMATRRQVVVGFAAETDDLVENARQKLGRKACDLIVANDVSRPDSTFGSDTDAVTFVAPDQAESLPALPKSDVARLLCDRVATALRAKRGG